MLLALPTYSAVPVVKRAVYARVNDAGLVAGVRLLPETGPPPSQRFQSGPDPLSTPDVFVWKGGKVVFHDSTFASVAGPNARGEVALGGPRGLFVWKGGGLARCLETPIAAIAGIADDGSVLATITAGEGFGNRKPSVIWPSNQTADGHYRFGPEMPQGAEPTYAPSGATAYAPDGGTIFVRHPMNVSGTDGGTTVRTPNGAWTFDTSTRQTVPHGLARNGYAIASWSSPATLWHNGDELRLQRSYGSSHKDGVPDGVNAVNGRGETVGSLDGHAVLYANDERIALDVASGVAELADAVAISENGNVLANAGTTLYLLRRRL